MWSPLSKLFEFLGAFRLPTMRGKTRLRVGNPRTPDHLGGAAWKNFLVPRKLSETWGPHAQGPWKPFHCITLFVSLDYLEHEHVGPADQDPLPVRNFVLPSWVDSGTMLLVDMPGPESAALGAALAVAGCDIVCTFNNWPNAAGVVKPEETLAVLLRYASWIEADRSAFPTPAPVAWLCDAERLGKAPGKPGNFDNRYYLEDSLFPGHNFLKEQGISKVVHLTVMGGVLNGDVAVHLHAYQKEGIQLYRASVLNGALLEPQPFDLPLPEFKTSGFFRSSAGGFGAPVPHPSSGG